MGTTFYLAWEPALMVFLQRFMGPLLTQIGSVITLFGEETILVAVLGFLYWCYDKEYAKYIGTNIVVGIVLNPLVKNVVLRRRPYFDHEGIRCLKPVDGSADIYDISAQGYSFPSGHSMNSVIVYGSLAKFRRNRILTGIAIAFPLLIGLSRVMLGVHYPTDVLVGWVLGAICVFFVSWLQKKVRRRWLLHFALVMLALPGMFYCKTTDYFTGLGIMIGFFLALPFEERFVRFQETRSVLISALRLLGGGALYFGLNTLLKLPFSEAFLASQTTLAFLVRTVRYIIVVFVILGIYPMLFQYERRKEK